jgi:2-oxoglutarate ferredoxin oxidoreductase subunit alpha
MKVGFFRPITLFPFPEEELLRISQRVKRFLVVEMNTGQMVEDVKLAVARDAEVRFYGHPPGSPPVPEELLAEIQKAIL